jgi:DNA-binding IclR family transcriptional regulator
MAAKNKQAEEAPASSRKKGEDVVGTVERAIRLLQFIAEQGRFNLKDAAAALRLPPSTVHRLLQLLVRMDLVERDDQQNYHVGREYYRMGALATERFDWHQAAHSHLMAIHERFNETCSFALYLPATLSGMIVETVSTTHPLQYRIDPFMHWPLAWGSLGRAILAYLSEDEIDGVLASASPSPATSQPVPTKQSLAAELAGIRLLGHYVSINQNVLGATGTAAPVLGLGGRVIGALGITIPVPRYRPEQQPEFTAAIMEHAQLLSESLGYRGEEVPGAAGAAAVSRSRHQKG